MALLFVETRSVEEELTTAELRIKPIKLLPTSATIFIDSELPAASMLIVQSGKFQEPLVGVVLLTTNPSGRIS